MKTIDELLSELRHLDVKLWADGDRLRYRASTETLTPVLLTQLRERKAEILTFLHKANTAARSNLSPILPVKRNGNLPLSFAQARLWFLEQLAPGSVHNIPVAYRLTGSLNLIALERSLGEIVRRHESLRTTFLSVDGKLCQVIAPGVTLPLPVIDLRGLTHQREAEAQRKANEEAQQPFDLAKGPLLRVKLLRLSEEEHMLLLTMHHIVSDGWSLEVFFRELTALYETFCAAKPSPLPELPIQYADFAHWQRQWLQGEVLESQLDYWKQQLGGNLPLLQLPTDHPRPPIQTYRGAVHRLMLPKTLTEALKALSQRSGTTLFMTLLAAFKILLYRYSGQEDIIVGSPTAGRNQVETEGMIGFFVNTLVLRTYLGGNPSFRELLDRVREVSLGAYAHQDLPFEKLVEELQPERDRSRSPLFQVIFALNPPWSALELPISGLTIKSLFGYVHSATSKFDLNLVMRDTGQGLRVSFEYNTDLFDAATITRMLGHFQTLLSGIVANPDQCLSDLPLLTAAERHQLLATYMVPSAFVFFDALPLTPNDKVDRRTLPAPDQFSQELEETFVASRDELELQLTKIWEKVLGIQPIGIRDNFFDLGGHSLLAVRLFAQIEKTFDTNLSLATLFQAPTIEQLASTLRQRERSAPWSPLVTIQASGSKPPLFCIHGGGFNVLIYRDLAINLGSDQPVYGLQARGLDGNEPLHNRLENMAADYIRQLQTVQPEGPYFLAGLSNGGNIALEMAQQLHAQGQKVALLAMFDSHGPDSIKLLPPIPRLLSSLRYALRYSVPRFVVKLLQLEPKVATAAETPKNVGAFKRMSDEQRDKATVKQLKAGRITDGNQHFPTNISYLECWINNLSMFILEHSPWAFFSPTAQLQGMEGSLPHTLQKIEEAHIKAQKAYVPRVYPSRITLFRAGESPPGFHLDPQLGWGKIAAGGLEIYEVPGHHSSIVESPVLAEKMRACLDKAQVDPSFRGVRG